MPFHQGFFNEPRLDLPQVDCVSAKGEQRQKRALTKSISHLAPVVAHAEKNPVDLS